MTSLVKHISLWDVDCEPVNADWPSECSKAYLDRMTLVVSESRSDFVSWNVCCSGECKSIASFIAAKASGKLIVIVLNTLVIREKSRVRVIFTCRVICIAKEVQHSSRHFFNPFNLVFSVHACVPAEVLSRIGFKLVGCS